jgi:hypothetical protein
MRKTAARLAGLAAVVLSFAGMLTAAAAPVAALPGHPSTGPRLVACAGSTVRPSVYSPICNDGEWSVVAVHWSSWGGGTARGSGLFLVHDCAPNCGQGKVTLYPVDLTASRVQGGDYTRLAYFFPHRVPKGFPRGWTITYYRGSWHGRVV